MSTSRTVSFEGLWESGSIERGLKTTENLIKNFTSLTVKSGANIDAEYQKMTEAIHRGFERIGKDISLNEAAIESLKKKLIDLSEDAKARANSGKKDMRYYDMVSDIQDIQIEIEKRKKATKALIEQDAALEKLSSDVDNHKAKLDNASNAQVRFRTQLLNVKQQMMELEQAGKRNTAEYARLTEEAKRLASAMYAANQQIKTLTTTKGATLQGLVSGLSGFSGAFTAAQGAIGLFASKNEELQKIMLRVQSLMSITMGLQAVSATLHQTSAFRIAVLSKAQATYNAILLASGKALIRFGLSANTARIAVQAFYGTLTLGLAVAIPVAINAISKLISKQKEAKKEQEELRKESQKLNEYIKDEIKTVGTHFFSLKMLQNQWNSLGNDLNKQQKFITDNKSEFDKLGVSINNVKEAESLLVENTSAFIEALKSRAKATAAQKLASEKYAEAIKQQMEADKIIVDNSPYFGTNDAEEKAKELAKNIHTGLKNGFQSSADSLRNEADKLFEYALQESNKANQLLTGGKKDKNKKEKDPVLQELEEKKKDYQEYFKWVNSTDEYVRNSASKTFSELLKGGGSYKEYLTNQISSLRELQNEGTITAEQLQKLQKLTTALQDEANKTVMSEFEKNIEKQMNEAQTVKQMFDVIEQQRKQLEESGPLKAEKEKIINKQEEDVVKKQEETTKKLIEEYSNYLDKKITLDLELTSDLQLLEAKRAKATTEEDKKAIDNVINNREKKYKEYNQNLLREEKELQLKIIDLYKDNEIIKIQQKKYLWEADRRKDILDIQKKAAEETEKILNAIPEKFKTDELRYEIERITLEINEMNEELKQIPVQKIQEMLTGFKQVTDALSELGGEIGEVFSSFGNAIDSISEGFEFINKENKSISDYAGQASNAIAGIVDVINMVSSASAERKRVEKEFYQNQIALVHEYALALNEQLRIQSELSGSGFVNDYAGKLKDGFNALSQATAQYQDTLGKLSEGKTKIDLRNSIDWGNVGKGTAAGAAAGAAIGSLIVPGIGTAIGAAAGAVAGFFTGLFGGKKKKETYGGLLEVFPELVDGAGNLNRELSESIINTNQVDDNTKQLIQNALDWADAVEEANKQVKEVVTDLAGDLGNSIKTAMIDAWKAGEDSSTKMFEAASQSLEKFIEDLVYSTVFSDIFDEFADRLAQSLSPRGDGDVIDDYDYLMDELDKRDDLYLASLDAIRNRAKQRGYDLWIPDETPEDANKPTSSLSGAIKGASQQEINALAGYMNNTMVSQHDATELIRNQLLHLASIDMKMGISNQHLESIDSKMSNNNIDPLRAQGITTG